MKKSKYTILDLQKMINATPPEYFVKRQKELQEIERTLERECEKGNHQGTLSNPIFSGNDIFWECSRCHRRVLDSDGNRPMTI